MPETKITKQEELLINDILEQISSSDRLLLCSDVAKISVRHKPRRPQYKTQLNRDIVFVFNAIFHGYCFYLKTRRIVLKRKRTEHQKLRLRALQLAPLYGTIIIDPESRRWVVKMLRERNITDKDEAFMLVWTHCINHRKRRVSENGQNKWTDLILLTSMVLACLMLGVSIFLTVNNLIVLTLIGLYYLKMIIVLFRMNKALAFDGNRLIRQMG